MKILTSTFVFIFLACPLVAQERNASVGILSPAGAAFSTAEEALNSKKKLLNQAIVEKLGRISEKSVDFKALELLNTPVGFPTLLRTRIFDRGNAVRAYDPQQELSTYDRVLNERVIGTPNFLPVSFLLKAAITTRPVGRIAYKFGPAGSIDVGVGTGFLVSPNWVLTNNHVIGSSSESQSYTFQLNYQFDENETFGPLSVYEFDPGEQDGVTGFYTSPADKLDFSLIRIKRPAQSTPTEPFGSIRLNPNLSIDSVPLGSRVNVIQHPQGRHKEVVIHDNQYTELYADFIRYVADTDPGSSGSPVFDGFWNVIALHHSAGEFENGNWVNNEGVRIDSIITKLRETVPEVVASELGL